MASQAGASRNDQKNLEKAEKVEKTGPVDKKAKPTPSIAFKSAYREHVVFYTLEERDIHGRVLKPANAIEFDNFNASVPSKNETALTYLRDHQLYGTKLLEQGVHY